MMSRGRNIHLPAFLIQLAIAITTATADQPIPIQVFTGSQFIPQDYLTYKSSIPWYFEIPIKLNETELGNFTSSTHCDIDKNSTQCLIEKNLNLIQVKILHQIKLQQTYFMPSNTTNVRNQRAILLRVSL